MIVSNDFGRSKDSIISFLDRLLTYLPNEIKMIDYWSTSPANQFVGDLQELCTNKRDTSVG